jgi:hypothetical protein
VSVSRITTNILHSYLYSLFRCHPFLFAFISAPYFDTFLHAPDTGDACLSLKMYTQLRTSILLLLLRETNQFILLNRDTLFLV